LHCSLLSRIDQHERSLWLVEGRCTAITVYLGSSRHCTTLLLATAALFKALAAETYGHATFIALGLVLCATYSVVAAVGSATGQRMSAALSEDSAASHRTAAQKAIDEATSRLTQIPQNRPSGAIEVEIQGILIDPRLEGCKVINGPRTREKCPHVSGLRK